MQSSINDKSSLLEILISHRKEIRNYGVEQLGLFGSFAKNEVTKNSDIDLLVEFDKSKKTYDNFFELSDFLEGILKRKVELVTYQSLSKYIGPHILKDVVNVAI
jgi:predicted nucleotidyltransferase